MRVLQRPGKASAPREGERRGQREPERFVCASAHRPARAGCPETPLSRTELSFSVSKHQPPNHYFKEAKSLEFCQRGKKTKKSVCSPPFWELIKLFLPAGGEKCGLFCSSVCSYLLPALALRFARGGSLQEGTRNLARQKAAQRLLPGQPVKTKLPREYQAAYFILQTH